LHDNAVKVIVREDDMSILKNEGEWEIGDGAINAFLRAFAEKAIRASSLKSALGELFLSIEKQDKTCAWLVMNVDDWKILRTYLWDEMEINTDYHELKKGKMAQYMTATILVNKNFADPKAFAENELPAELALASDEFDGDLVDGGIMNKPKVVCLCGSTRFYKEFMEANFDETMKGNIVLSVGFFPQTATQSHGEAIGISVEQKRKLDELHKRKIDLADEVLILNVGGYIGESTRSELQYACHCGKLIRYLEPKEAQQSAGKGKSEGTFIYEERYVVKKPKIL
jgi:hypothetical protein